MLAWKQLFIQRVRNSSLVERQSVDNKRASSISPKFWTRKCGRGAFHSALKLNREIWWSVWMIERIKKETGLTNAKIIATGGLSQIVQSVEPLFHYVDRELSLKGLYEIYKMNA